MEGDTVMDVIVGSLSGTVSGSSLITIRLPFWPGLLAVISTEFLKNLFHRVNEQLQ